MLSKIKAFFSSELSLENQTAQADRMHLAAAALLIELSHSDTEQDSREQASIEKALQDCFQLNQTQLQTLIDLAEQERREATSLYQFTSLIREQYTAEQRSELIKMLWQVAAADGEICKYEDHLIRKIADLLYVPHSEFIRTKLAVLQPSD